MRYIKLTSWYLGISIFMFGILKLVSPFKDWYNVQITNSELGQLSYPMGISGEIIAGLILIICLLYKQKMTVRLYYLLTNTSFVMIVIMMSTAIYVHLNPNVPADVLPLKIKQPFIPIFLLLIALLNILLSLKQIAGQIEKQKA